MSGSSAVGDKFNIPAPAVSVDSGSKAQKEQAKERIVEAGQKIKDGVDHGVTASKGYLHAGAANAKFYGNKAVGTSKSFLQEVNARLHTPRAYASSKAVSGCLMGALAGVATYAALVYKGVAIEVFKGLLLHDLVGMAAVGLATAYVVMMAIRLLKATGAAPETAAATATTPPAMPEAAATTPVTELS